MTRASVAFGTARIDRLENVRLEFGRMLREIRSGEDLTLSTPVTLPSGATAFRSVSFRRAGSAVRYTWMALDSDPTTEWALVRIREGGVIQTLIPGGVRDFWLQSIPPPGQPMPSGREATTVMAYLMVYPDDASRPLPDLQKAPIELGSCVTLRN
jgi:hypothetical protein